MTEPYSTTIVPAAPDFWAVWDHDCRLPIVAWAVTTKESFEGERDAVSAYPVWAGHTDNSRLPFIEAPDGTLSDLDGRTFRDLDAALAVHP